MSDLTPQEQAAQQFMAWKGLPDELPVEIEKLADQPCWYFYYELPEGDLELEVNWTGREWQTTVTAFHLVQLVPPSASA